MRRLAPCVTSCCVLVLGACATVGAGDKVSTSAAYESCQMFFERLDGGVRAADVADAQSARVPDFIYLRADRFLASDIKPPDASPAFDAWAERLRRLDQRARTHENANLPLDVRRSLRGQTPNNLGLDESVTECGRVMLAEDLADTAARRALSEAAMVPSSYSTLKRVVGLYPLSSQVFLAGVGRLHNELKADFRANPQPQTGRLVRYVPRTTTRPLRAVEVSALLAGVSENPLGVPAPNDVDMQRLFDTFAPVWVVDAAGPDDYIGAPVWPAPSDVAAVETSEPTVYTHVSYARLGGRTLLQLNYVIWFSARPLTGAFDLLGGHLDGLTWRVTLASDGLPLLYDSMHNCGCYHLFVLAQGMRPRAHARYEEAPLVVRVLPRTTARPVVRIATGSHYLRDVGFLSVDIAEERLYAFSDYDDLRSLPYTSARRRSLFESDGIVAGTERGERFFFWPMGVPAPGAMRQWGHHAVVFVGERYFDDPDLIERYFDLELVE